jgi:hypothetical protein
MKKVLAITSLLMVVATSCFAGALTTGLASSKAAKVYGGVDATAAQNAPTPLIKFSTGVNGVVNFSNATEYLLGTKHETGSKIFGTCNSVNNIYWKQSIAGSLGATGVSLGFTTATSSNFVGNGWTSY